MYTISILALLLTRLSNRLFHRSSPEWIQYASIRSRLTWESRIDRPFFPFRENEDWQGPRVGRHESFYPHVEPSDAASFLRKGTLSMTGGGQLANWRAPINRGQLRCVEDDRARLTVLRIVGVAYRLPFSSDDRQTEVVRGCRACPIVEYPSGNWPLVTSRSPDDERVKRRPFNAPLSSRFRFRIDKKGRFGLYARQTLVLTRMTGGHLVEGSFGCVRICRERREGTNTGMENWKMRCFGSE